MKTNKLLVFGFGLLISLGTLLFVNNGQAFAATKTWDGEGSDNNFSTAANWNADSVPTNGDSLVFPTSVDADTTSGDDRVLANDMSSLSVAGIAVTGSYITNDLDRYKITGNAMTVTGNVSGDDSPPDGAWIDIEVALTAAAPVQFIEVRSTSSLAIGSNAVTLMASSFDGGVSGSGTVSLGGYPSNGGSGGGCSFGTATAYPFSGDSSSFSGAIVVLAHGFMEITSNSSDLANHASGLTLESGGFLAFTLNAASDMSYAKPITMNGGTISTNQMPLDGECTQSTASKTVTITGAVTVTQPVTINMYNHANLAFTGALNGGEQLNVAEGLDPTLTMTLANGSVVKSALKIITITDANKSTYCDSTYGMSYLAEFSKFIVNVNCTGSGELEHGIYGILAGTGTVGPIRVSARGIVAPGQSPGILTTGNYSMVSGGTYQAELGGTAEGEYDQLKVVGTVNLNAANDGGGTLSTSLYGTFKPAVGNKFTIIDNDSTDAVSGTFAGLAEGATFEVGGVVFKISYVGGTGNDVVLTVMSIPAAPDTGFAKITSNPALAFGTTTVLAGAIYMISRKQHLLFKK